MIFHVKLKKDEESDWIVAECPALPGCISQGKTRQDAVKNIRDAINAYLHSLKKHREPIPPSIEEEIVEVKI